MGGWYQELQISFFLVVLGKQVRINFLVRMEWEFEAICFCAIFVFAMAAGQFGGGGQRTPPGELNGPKKFPDRQSVVIQLFRVDNKFHLQYLPLIFVFSNRGDNLFFFKEVVPLVRLRLPRGEILIRILCFSSCFFDSGVVELRTDRKVSASAFHSMVVIRIGRDVPFARDAMPSCRVHDKFLVITGAYLRTKIRL